MKKRLLRILGILLGLPIALAILGYSAFLLVNQTNGVLVSSGEERAYLLYVPESYDPASPTPLVISLHGFAEWPAHQMEISRWNRIADEFGFLVVYPSGVGFPLRWRAYDGSSRDSRPMTDVTFISDLIDALSSGYQIDATRVYVNGLSNGGGMSFLLSCELSERVAAFGSVSGAYLLPWDACTPSRKVPAIIFHGTADPIVPFEGGPSNSFDLPFPAIANWVATLAERNGCDAVPEDLPTQGEAQGVRFKGCTADVIFYTIEGSGHGWPGGEPIPEWIVGYTSMDIDATQTMWDFFMQHKLPGD
jgi:polyhydroxybutyrate depolymerase